MHRSWILCNIASESSCVEKMKKMGRGGGWNRVKFHSQVFGAKNRHFSQFSSQTRDKKLFVYRDYQYLILNFIDTLIHFIHFQSA